MWWRFYNRKLDNEACYLQLQQIVEASRAIAKSNRTWTGACSDSWLDQVLYDIEPTGEDQLLYGAFMRITVIINS